MAKKKVIDEIFEKINVLKLRHNIKPYYIIIHPDKERSIFVNNEITKSADLSEYLGVKVIISKEVEKDEIIVGI